MRGLFAFGNKALICASVMALLSFSAAAQQAGLTVGGRFVPKDSFMLFIDMGNSAMSGRDKSPDTFPDPHLWKFEMEPPKHDWLPAREPISDDGNNTIGAPKGGPIMPFLKKLHVNYPSYYFGVMQMSGSGWSLKGYFCQTCGNPTDDTIKSLLNWANQLKPNVTIAGIVSMLNILEVQNKDTAGYLGNVKAMVDNIRSSLGPLQCNGKPYIVPYIHAGYPVLAGSNSTASYDTSTPQAKSIIRQIAQIPGTIQESIVIPTDGLTICTTCSPTGYLSHYDPAGNLGWGNRTADSVKARNWIPPVCPECVDVSKSLTAHSEKNHVPAIHRVLFDGSNWSVFDKTGKSFGVYSLNGKSVSIAAGAAIRSQKLLPGVYFVRPEVKN
jgi:Carbohydrate esterase, sialic acid-specific acetylesterase